MPVPEAPQVCSRCDAPVSMEDLTQGLAIHMDGVPVCPNCIELLPVQTRLQINQVRASKGLAVTVYKMPHPRHPRLTLYTFSSTGLFTVHRRALRLTGTYDVRPLSYKPWFSEIDRLVAGRSRWLFIGGVSLAVGVVGLLIWTTLGGHRIAEPDVSTPGTTVSEKSAPSATPAPPGATAPALPAPVLRQDLPQDPWQAWDQIRSNSQATPALIDEIGREVANRREAELMEISGVLDREGPDAAIRRLVEQRQLENAPVFSRVRALESALVTRIGERRQVATVPPSAVPLPASPQVPNPPVPVPVPVVEPTRTIGGKTEPVANLPPGIDPASAEKPAVPSRPRQSPEELDWSAIATTGGRRAVLAVLTEPGDPVVPSPWPQIDNSQELPEFIHSEEEKTASVPGWKGRQAIHLELPARLVAGGGLTLVAHAGSRLAKRELVVQIDAGRRAQIPITLDGSWGTVVIPIEGVEALPDNAPVVIHLGDADPVKTLGKGPFWLGPGLATAGHLPRASEVSVLPPVIPWDLVVGEARTREILVQMINRAVFNRVGRTWLAPGGFNPWAIKVLCARRSAEWTAAMRQVLPRPIDVATLAQGTVNDFLLEPKWWLEHQLAAAKPVVDNKKFHVLCVIPNGAESELSAERWASQLKELTSQILMGTGRPTSRAGFLPVVVLGSVDDPGYTPGNWAKAREELERQGIPLIDLLVLPRDGLSKKAWMARSSKAIAHGLANLAYQLRWRQNKK